MKLRKTWRWGRHGLWALLVCVSLTLSLQAQQDGGTRPIRATAVHTVVGGRVRLQFSDAFRGALRRAHIAYDAVGASTTEGDAVLLPVADGLFDLASGRGTVVWRGGLALETPKADVDLRGFRMDTVGRLPLLWTTLVVEGELADTFPLCTVALPTTQLPARLIGGRVLTLRDVELRLTAEGAACLNRLSASERFASGQVVGLANIIAIVE
ncbi:MAG: hypothetical protein SNJ67_06075 [Chloracidobacterium sp.]|uniref:Lipid/polyisoprenoid-binding YceI-like domain-containing protein n=1 Tax=Chloracidobacterium validum TaxID=2821543 RepID=A0ABX8BCC7_9BACT|nr:hypothetical protein [Chloracidobacterium validum]QUW04582.1 hypothetical protein J8C06_12425 [Chloracidobacterium validum]